ncbi:MAG: RNA methyltransferase [Acidobacteria bacterium]|nr:RNA methyltransferase [Acidobacteriota bacterium]
MPLITSRQHAIVRQCRAVARGDDRRLLLDGWHLLDDALGAGFAVETVAAREEVSPGQRATLDRAARAGAEVVRVSAAVMDALSPVPSPTGVVAIAARPAVDPRALTAPAPALVVAGFGIQDPGNAGAIARAADAGGATGVLLDASSADPWGWKALRAAMGSTLRLPVLRDRSALHRLKAWQADGLRVVAADPDATVRMYDERLDGPTALVVGSEGAGVPADVLRAADARVRIPMRARVESLNVAVAAAVLLYEAARQREWVETV